MERACDKGMADEIQKIVTRWPIAARRWNQWCVLCQGYIPPLGVNLNRLLAQSGRHGVGLTRASPHLPPSLQQQVSTYLQSLFRDYHPCSYTHIGWSTGAGREGYDLPPEVAVAMPQYPPSMYSTYGFAGWTGPDWKWTPHTFYALWKYAETFGNARSVVRPVPGSGMGRPAAMYIGVLYPFGS